MCDEIDAEIIRKDENTIVSLLIWHRTTGRFQKDRKTRATPNPQEPFSAPESRLTGCEES